MFYQNSAGKLEHDFVLAPGAALERIELEARGARIDSRGELRLGSVSLRKPVAYQPDGEKRRPVACRYVRRGKGRFGFALGAYDFAHW